MNLWLELGAAVLIVPLLAIVHGVGLLGISRLLNIQDEQLVRRSLDMGSFWLLPLLGLALFAIHMIEISLFAAFYLAVGAATTIENALFYSASAYTTAGAGADRLPEGWRLVGEAEALLGLLLVGWSTAYLVGKLNKLRE